MMSSVSTPYPTMKASDNIEVVQDQYECTERNLRLRKTLRAIGLLGAAPGYTWSLAERSVASAALVTAYLLSLFAMYHLLKIKKIKRRISFK